jgi:hypothetical protein
VTSFLDVAGLSALSFPSTVDLVLNFECLVSWNLKVFHVESSIRYGRDLCSMVNDGISCYAYAQN